MELWKTSIEVKNLFLSFLEILIPEIFSKSDRGRVWYLFEATHRTPRWGLSCCCCRRCRCRRRCRCFILPIAITKKIADRATKIEPLHLYSTINRLRIMVMFHNGLCSINQLKVIIQYFCYRMILRSKDTCRAWNLV